MSQGFDLSRRAHQFDLARNSARRIDKVRDWVRASYVANCPAVECEAQVPPQQISAKKFPELHAELEKFSAGQPYDYYHCRVRCDRIWRIMRVDPLRDDYQPPECMGSMDQSRARIFAPRESDIRGPQDLKWTYCQSKSNPRGSAHDRTDAQR